MKSTTKKSTTKKIDKELNGAGLIDFIKNPIAHLKEAMLEVPSKLNNISRRTLETYGNIPVKKLTVMRAPLKSHWTNALNTLSMGKFNELKEKYGFDKLFHLSLIANVGEDIILEKNEVIHVAELKSKGVLDPSAEFYDVPLHGKTITLLQMIENTNKLMGDKLFYDYDALRGNNCQDFIKNLLASVNLLSDGALKFIFQDISKLTNDLLKSKKHAFVPVVTQKITRMGSALSRLIGKGVRQDVLMTKDMVDFIHSGGFEFL